MGRRVPGPERGGVRGGPPLLGEGVHEDVLLEAQRLQPVEQGSARAASSTARDQGARARRVRPRGARTGRWQHRLRPSSSVGHDAARDPGSLSGQRSAPDGPGTALRRAGTRPTEGDRDEQAVPATGQLRDRHPRGLVRRAVGLVAQGAAGDGRPEDHLHRLSSAGRCRAYGAPSARCGCRTPTGAAGGLVPGLLEDLAHDGLLDGLVELAPPPGASTSRPRARAGGRGARGRPR